MKLSFLYGGSIVTQNSRVLIEDIDLIEEISSDQYRVRGTAVEYPSIFEKPKRYTRWTTITLDED